jgi:hypothetical protein
LFRLNPEDIQIVIDEIFGKEHSRIVEFSPTQIFDALMDQTTILPTIEPPPSAVPLSQQLVVSISHASNLDQCLRVKHRAQQINYETIDPMVSITCDFKTKDSTVLLGHIHVGAHHIFRHSLS